MEAAADFLKRRRSELADYASHRGIEWEASLTELPADDDALMITALASLLRVDIERVFYEDVEVADLQRESQTLEIERDFARQHLYGPLPSAMDYEESQRRLQELRHAR